jgi:two-component system, chemotaxis family, sensor kinase CheA
VGLDLQKYLSLYVAEASEHLSAFANGLLALERAVATGEGDRKSIVDGVFRHAHSVKGMSASMSLHGIAALAHSAEDLVDVFRRLPAAVDAGAVDLLLTAGDALGALVAAAAAGGTPDADPVLVAKLAAAAERARAPDAAGSSVRGSTGSPRTEAGSARTESGSPRVEEVRPSTEVRPPTSGAVAPFARDERGGAAAPASVRRVQVDVDVAASCPVPAVRAFLVVKKLSGAGSVVRTTPATDELKAGRIPGKKLRVVLDTGETLQALERVLAQISDLAGVTVREAERPAPAPAVAAAKDPAVEPARTVRVKTQQLDDFLDLVGELILATARLRELGRALPDGHRPPVLEGVDRLHAIVKDLHDKVMTVRMTPLAVATEPLPRAAREVAKKLGKQVEVELHGAEIELDRAILEELGDPLQHVLRNSIDHGIEAPHLRLLAGKPATGKVRIHGRRERDRVIVEISDDGKGMDAAKLKAAAVARGALSPEQAAALGDREALLLACLPGVSTAEIVTDVSGRGVGLDAVKRTIESLGGALEIESTPGQGSRFTFRLPLTVAVQPVLLVRVGDEVLALPIAKVHGAVQVPLDRLDRSRGTPMLPYDGELVPVHELQRLLGLPGGAAKGEGAIVVTESGEARMGLAVDALLGQQEAVLKPLSGPLAAVPGLSAVTVLGNGRPVFILDVARLHAG